MTYTTGSGQGFELIKARREQLARLVGAQLDLARRQQLDRWVERLDALERRVLSDSFKILVAGQFNSGKTTTINAMLGVKVLPTYATPTTAVINEVKHGESPYAVLHPTPTDDQRHPEPVRISVDELERHVVIDDEDDQRENPYDRVEVFWPLDLCRSGVELVDSPGLNEDPIREDITIRYLAEADAVIFLLNALAPVADNERGFIEAFIRPLGHDDLFFVVNKINFVEEDERARVEAHCRRKLAPLVKYDERIYFVDARGALQARQKGDDAALLLSGMLPFERSLEHFLTTQRGRLKVLAPARELQEAVDASRRAVQERRALLATELDELTRRYEASRQPLALLEADLRRISEAISQENRLIVRDVHEAAVTFLEGLARRLPDLVLGSELKAKVSVNPWKVRQQTERVVEEQVELIGAQLHIELGLWRAGAYSDLLRTRLQDLENRVRRSVEDFATGIDAVRIDLTAEIPVPAQPDDVLAAYFSDPAGSIRVEAGPVRGVSGAAVSVLPKMALALASLAIGFAPVVMIPVALAWAAESLGSRGERTTERVRQKVVRQVAAELTVKAAEHAAAITRETGQTLDELREAVVGRLQEQVDEVRSQVEHALADKQRGSETTEQGRRDLDEIEAGIEAVDRELERLVDQVHGLVRQAQHPSIVEDARLPDDSGTPAAVEPPSRRRRRTTRARRDSEAG